MPGGQVHHVSGGTLFSTDSPAKELSGPLVPLAGASLTTIEQARALVRSQRREFGIDLVDEATDLDGLLGNEGFDRVDSRIVMTARADIGEPSHITRAATGGDLDSAVELQVSAFDMAVPAARSLYGPGWLDTPSAHIAVEAGGRLVAMATTHPTEHGIGVFGVCTHPDRRGKGFATAAVRSAVAAVADPDDPRPVWLRCGQDLVSVYESMGFEPAGRTSIWVEGYA